MKLIAYPTTSTPTTIRPANPKRDWMDVAANKNPYRCLPLSMANAWGWEILSSAKFIAEWDGGMSPKSVKVTKLDGHGAPDGYFGEGTLTWHPGYMFKTEFPYGLYVTGAPNNPKPNAIPLSGVVETHWLPFTFTMNWRFTQPGSFSMEIGEPFCQIFPVDMNIFEGIEAEIRSLHEPEAKDFHDSYWEWNLSRHEFLHGQKSGRYGPEDWQRNYFQGNYPPGEQKCPVHKTSDGTPITSHRTKPNTPIFEDKQIGTFKQPEGFSEKVRAIAANHPKSPVVDNGQKTELELRLLELKPKIMKKMFSSLKIDTAPTIQEPPKVTQEKMDSMEDKINAMQTRLKNMRKQ